MVTGDDWKLRSAMGNFFLIIWQRNHFPNCFQTFPSSPTHLNPQEWLTIGNSSPLTAYLSAALIFKVREQRRSFSFLTEKKKDKDGGGYRCKTCCLWKRNLLVTFPELEKKLNVYIFFSSQLKQQYEAWLLRAFNRGKKDLQPLIPLPIPPCVFFLFLTLTEHLSDSSQWDGLIGHSPANLINSPCDVKTNRS